MTADAHADFWETRLDRLGHLLEELQLRRELAHIIWTERLYTLSAALAAIAMIGGAWHCG